MKMREFLILIIFVFFYWVRIFFVAAKIALITSILVITCQVDFRYTCTDLVKHIAVTYFCYVEIASLTSRKNNPRPSE